MLAEVLYSLTRPSQTSGVVGAFTPVELNKHGPGGALERLVQEIHQF